MAGTVDVVVRVPLRSKFLLVPLCSPIGWLPMGASNTKTEAAAAPSVSGFGVRVSTLHIKLPALPGVLELH